MHRRVVRAGPATAIVTAPKGVLLRLSLIDSRNKELAAVTGKTPLMLSRSLDAGLYWFGVAGTKSVSASYTLTVTALP